MNKITNMKKIIEILNEASSKYYNTGDSDLTDAEFDALLEKLKYLEEETGTVLSNSPTINVGAPVLKNLQEVTHDTPMLSLEKCRTVEEIEKFSAGKQLVSSIKLDGLTVRLTYENGNLVKAETRGNGIVGSDVTEAVKQFENIPLHINKEETYIIDGEALIKLDDFEKINTSGEYKNSRNLAAGTLSLLDMNLIKKRHMNWYAWENVEGSSKDTFMERLIEASGLGFSVVPFCLLKTGESIQGTIDGILHIAETTKLPQDGVVFKFNDVAYGKSLGSTSHHYRNGIAWKEFNNSTETELIGIEFSMGKTGDLTPVAIFKPVEIYGTTVERASLHNLSVMKDILKHPFKGQKIGVSKRNMIIPYVEWGEDNYPKNVQLFIDIPHTCPLCGGETTTRKDNDTEVLCCTNPNCSGKLLGRLSHAVSKNALNIDGLSEKNLEKFIQLGYINNLKDIYNLSDYKTQLMNLEGFGSRSVEKLLTSIGASRKTTFKQFLYSLSIPLIGKTASKDLEKFIYSKISSENNLIEDFVDLVIDKPAHYWEQIDSFGEKMSKSLKDYVMDNFQDILDFSKEFKFQYPFAVLDNLEEKSEVSLFGKTFVITGKLVTFKNRQELVDKIESLGGKVAGSVSKTTSYLINNDTESKSSKNLKAISLNIPIISESDFLKMCE